VRQRPCWPALTPGTSVSGRIKVNLVSLLASGGIRLFGDLATAPIELEGPEVTEGNDVDCHVPRRDA
jgi:hypothetical protein